ncbi:hypothetical protein DL89DRAFT_97047, partial [Linderina pennispora]
ICLYIPIKQSQNRLDRLTNASEKEYFRRRESPGYKLDPVGPVDTVIIITVASMYGATLFVLLYAWWNRNYPPIRRKNLLATTAMYITAALWLVGDIVTNGHVHLVGPFKYCIIWSAWFRMLFCYVNGCFVMIRLYALYRVFVQSRPSHSVSYWAPLIVLAVPILAFCITPTALDKMKIAYYIQSVELCNYTDPFRYTFMALMWLIWLTNLILMILIRKIQPSFREHHESFIISGAAIVNLVITTVVNVTNPTFALDLKLRSINTIFDCIGSILAPWIIIIFPCYQCFFHHHEYLRMWLDKLRADGLAKQYEISTETQFGNRCTSYSRLGSDKEHITRPQPEDNTEFMFHNSTLNIRL